MFNATAPSESRNQWRTIRELVRHLWPKDRIDLRVRVILAVLCLISAKLVNVYVPFLLKRAVDELSLGKEHLLVALIF